MYIYMDMAFPTQQSIPDFGSISMFFVAPENKGYISEGGKKHRRYILLAADKDKLANITNALDGSEAILADTKKVLVLKDGQWIQKTSGGGGGDTPDLSNYVQKGADTTEGKPAYFDANGNITAGTATSGNYVQQHGTQETSTGTYSLLLNWSNNNLEQETQAVRKAPGLVYNGEDHQLKVDDKPIPTFDANKQTIVVNGVEYPTHIVVGNTPPWDRDNGVAQGDYPLYTIWYDTNYNVLRMLTRIERYEGGATEYWNEFVDNHELMEEVNFGADLNNFKTMGSWQYQRTEIKRLFCDSSRVKYYGVANLPTDLRDGSFVLEVIPGDKYGENTVQRILCENGMMYQRLIVKDGNEGNYTYNNWIKYPYGMITSSTPPQSGTTQDYALGTLWYCTSDKKIYSNLNGSSQEWTVISSSDSATDEKVSVEIMNQQEEGVYPILTGNATTAAEDSIKAKKNANVAISVNNGGSTKFLINNSPALTESDITICTQEEYDSMAQRTGLLYFIIEEA